MIWSYGCAGQFKNARVFQWLCLLHIKYKVPLIWNYFETGHGKGEHDGAGEFTKTSLRREEIKFTGAHLRDAASIVQWCASIMGEQATRKHLLQRIFWEVTNVDRSQTHRVNTMHGYRQFHSIRSSDNSALQIWTRLKDFFCSSYSIGEWGDCENTNIVDTWDRVTLGTNFNGGNEIDHLEHDQTHISIDYDHISDLIQAGTKN